MAIKKKSGKSSGSKRLTTTTHSGAFDQAGGRRAQAAPVLIAKQATRYRAAVQQAENASQAATRAEKRAAEAGKRAEAREGQAQALDKLLDAKRPSLSAWIERSSSAGATAGTGRVLARADGHHCALTAPRAEARGAELLAGRHGSPLIRRGFCRWPTTARTRTICSWSSTS